MTQYTTLKEAPELKRIIQSAFPNYKKRNCGVSMFHPMNVNSYWDGGSKDEYVLVCLQTHKRLPLPTSTHPYFDVASKGACNGENDAISVDHVGNVTLKIIPPNVALVRAGYFCGKPATAHVYFHPSNMPADLTTEKPEQLAIAN